jgi:hypothetical protein
MTTPTPEEITTALDVLRRVPGVTDGHCLEDIVEIATPLEQAARELLTRWTDDPPVVHYAASQLVMVARSHGLVIDKKPGELIGWATVSDRTNSGGWVTEQGIWAPDDLEVARRCASPGERIVSLRLLPEGGKA